MTPHGIGRGAVTACEMRGSGCVSGGVGVAERACLPRGDEAKEGCCCRQCDVTLVVRHMKSRNRGDQRRTGRRNEREGKLCIGMPDASRRKIDPRRRRGTGRWSWVGAAMRKQVARPTMTYTASRARRRKFARQSKPLRALPSTAYRQARARAVQRGRSQARSAPEPHRSECNREFLGEAQKECRRRGLRHGQQWVEAVARR